jgi:hypothetical protein
LEVRANAFAGWFLQTGARVYLHGFFLSADTVGVPPNNRHIWLQAGSIVYRQAGGMFGHIMDGGQYLENP